MLDTRESTCNGGHSLRQRKSRRGAGSPTHHQPATGQGAPGRCEHGAPLVRQQRILCHLTDGADCTGAAVRAGGWARLDTRHKPSPNKQLAPAVRARHADPPWLSLPPPPQASPSPTVVVCHTSHAITAMIKATATSHRGHCGDHQFLIGLRLGLHLCYSMRTFQSFSALNQPQTPQWGL